jgi:hypothetical protein
VARENARVAAATKRAEAQEQRGREEIEKRRKADEQARIDAEQDERARKDRAVSAKEASCAADRDVRRRHLQEAIERATKDQARARELDAYIAKSCTRKEVNDYDRGKHEEVACPADAPPELRPGGSGIPSGVVSVQATPEERAKNDRCQDVQDLTRKK